MPVIRLDKYLATMGLGTRSTVKELIRKGKVTIGENIIKEPDTKVDTNKDKIFLDGKCISYVEYEYYMLNKPAGVLSAARDKKMPTVVDLIKTKTRDDLYPLGRLDKDTEGLLIITNDGDMTHKLLSPRYHVPKKYYAKVEGILNDEHVRLFREGMTLSDNTKLLPANLTILSHDDTFSYIELVIYEGKFHQVKRMVSECGGKVLYLKRLSMGDICLDESLQPGQYRKLTDEELNILKGTYSDV